MVAEVRPEYLSEWPAISQPGPVEREVVGVGHGDADRPNDFPSMAARSNQDDRFCGKFSR